jgi:hypothetical protein
MGDIHSLSHGRFKVTAWCLCGASMTGSGVGSLDAVDELTGAFWSGHTGPGHGPTDARKAYAARRKAERAVSDG